MSLKENSIFMDWSPKELAALKSATEKLRAEQPKKPRRINLKTGVKGCHYHRGHGKYLVYALIDGAQVYAGRMEDFDKDKAIAMQQIKIEEYNNKLLSKNED